jgi:hypothetical protein
MLLDNPEHADPPPPDIKLVFFPDFGACCA